MYEQLTRGLGYVQVVLEELLNREQRLLIERVDRTTSIPDNGNKVLNFLLKKTDNPDAWLEVQVSA